MEERRVGTRSVLEEQHSRQKTVCTCISMSPREKAHVARVE